MLDTLLKIGEWQSQGKSKWGRFLEYPKVGYKDKKGNPISNYVLPIIFDLDEMEVIIDKDNLKEYDELDVVRLNTLKIKGGNNKATYITVTAGKLIQLYKTFFGRYGEKTDKGEFTESIEKLDASDISNEFNEILSDIFKLKTRFLELVTKLNKKSNALEINIKALEERLELGKSEKLILLTAMVKSQKRSFESPIYFSEIPSYQKVVTTQFFGIKDQKSIKASSKKKLCYASGELSDNVEQLQLSERYSLNKMFVTETKNYASRFDKNKFPANYQVSTKNQENLDYASNLLLNEGYKVKIANVDHVIVPQLQHKADIDWEMVLTGIKKKSDILFHSEKLDHLAKDIKDETDDIFWINFVAFESDGNFFKSTEMIKDVSIFHFTLVLKAFNNIHWEMKEAEFIDWNSIMTEYGVKDRFLNFNTIYSLIPLRKDKEKKNKALDLFKAILENRKIKKDILYNYFTELILCHWFERYASYTNIQKSSKDYFKYSVRDSVFKYHAFIQVLKQLKLIPMEETKTSSRDETGNQYDQAIRGFIHKMALNLDQQAMFYLGRLLNAVEYIQKDKKKTVIHKVNFNGLDRDDIQRLRIALIEKAKQYNAIGKVIFIDKKFSELFDYNGWKMSHQEAVFFLLTGYSFGVGIKEAKKIEEIESDENNNL